MPPASTDNKPTENPYDFIVNQAPKPKRPSLLGSQTSFTKRLLIILGGGLGLIIVIIIFVSLLSSPPKTAGLVSAAEEQATLLSLSEVAGKTASQQITKNLAATVQLSLLSDQLSLVTYIKDLNSSLKITDTSLLTQQGTALTAQLSADPANSFDSEYVQLTQTHLSTYLNLLKQSYSSSDPTAEKILLSNLYNAANLLLKQANTTSTNLQ